jgi:hypothetical protein
MLRCCLSGAFRGVLPVGVLDVTEDRGGLHAALGVRVSHSPHASAREFILDNVSR